MHWANLCYVWLICNKMILMWCSTSPAISPFMQGKKRKCHESHFITCFLYNTVSCRRDFTKHFHLQNFIRFPYKKSGKQVYFLIIIIAHKGIFPFLFPLSRRIYSFGWRWWSQWIRILSDINGVSFSVFKIITVSYPHAHIQCDIIFLRKVSYTEKYIVFSPSKGKGKNSHCNEWEKQ